MLLGDADGSDDACTVGALVGSLLVGALLGLTVGEELGSDDVVPGGGALVGSLDGAQIVMQGSPVPTRHVVGCDVGSIDGELLGNALGDADGSDEGWADGSDDG